ncbi:MAG: hypothetical protein R3Y19_04615 [Rikenellaceae bacterium]
MRRTESNKLIANESYERQWLRNHGIYVNEFTYEQYAQFEIDWVEECEKKEIEEAEKKRAERERVTKEKKKDLLIGIIGVIVLFLIIWGILAAIADASGVGIGSVIGAILFFPAIFMAAKR